MLALSLGIMLQGGINRAAGNVPVLVGFANNNTGNPTIPTHQAGDLLVGAGFRANLTMADADAGWTNWAPDAGSQSDNGVSLRLVYQVASGPGTTISWTNATNARPVWVFRNAVLGPNRFRNVGSGSATCDWPELTLAQAAIVCILSYKASAQTNVAAVKPAEGTWNDRVTKSTSVASYIGDSGALINTSFAPADTTFDTATGTHQLLSFGIYAA